MRWCSPTTKAASRWPTRPLSRWPAGQRGAGARGEPLDRWLGRTGVELGVLIQTVRQRGSMRLFSTLLRGEEATAGRGLGFGHHAGRQAGAVFSPCATSAAG